MKVSAPYLSVVAPAYNEAEGIDELLGQWTRELARLEPNYEIILCDDGSTDETWNIIERHAKQHAQIKSLRLKRNHGAGVALATAIEHSSGIWVLLIDSDGQFSIRDYAVLRERQQRTTADAVIGVRTKKHDDLFARIGSASSARVSNALLGSRLRDFNSAFKLVRGDLLRSLTLDARRMNYSTDITAKLVERGAHIAEVNITHHDRTHGVSKLKFFRAARERFTFVMYLYWRSKLLRKGIIRAGPVEDDQMIRGRNWM